MGRQVTTYQGEEREDIPFQIRVLDIETKEPIEAFAKIINAKDCAHRFLMDTQFHVFKSPVEPEVGDIQFNEVMFNANDGSVDFLELINPNNKAIELNSINIDYYKS